MCFALKATNPVTFGPWKCISPISSGLLSGEALQRSEGHGGHLLEKAAQKKSVRSTSKIRRSLHLWPSMQSTFCWDLTGSKKMGTPLPSTVSVISLFLTNFMMTKAVGDLTQKLTQGQLRLAWFMQDGARPHTAQASLKHLRVFSRTA